MSPRRAVLALVIAGGAAIAGTGAAAAAAGPGTAGWHGSAMATARHRPRHAGAVVARVTIVGDDRLRFVPSVVPIRRPGRVEVTFTDRGAYPHNLVVPALRFTSTTVTGDPGSTTTRFFLRFPHKGRFSFHCAYHQSAGMTGVFVVG